MSNFGPSDSHALTTIDERVLELIANVNRWRQSGIVEYWLRVSYMGAELNRFGDHELTFAQGKLWHRWHGDWREIENGSDFWLFSVPGGFAWARDMVTKVLPERNEPSDVLRLSFDEAMGFLKFLQFEAGHRDASNFTFEVKRFGAGPHPDFRA